MLEIIDCDQGSPEWLLHRAGIPTASEFDTLFMSGKGGGESKTRKALVYTKAYERYSGKASPSYTNADMERGHEMEPDARNLYSFRYDADPIIIGFVRNGRKGASPDAFLDSNGILEIKSHKPSILIPMIQADVFPTQHMAQCQGLLWVCEREWVDLACYFPGLPLFVKRITRDEPYINNLSGEVDRFNDEVDAMVETLKTYEKAAA